MKVRHGFVSNSSSTSFSIFGSVFDYEQLKALLNYAPEQKKADAAEEVEEDDGDNWDEREAVQNLLDATIKKQKAKLSCYENDEGTTYIGRNYESIKDNETGKNFRDGVRKDMKNVFGKAVKCESITTEIQS